MEPKKRREFIKIFLGGVLFFSVVLAAALFLSAGYDLGKVLQLGSVLPVTITENELHVNYKTRGIRVLIVPGHDNEYTGGSYRDLKENTVTTELARHLYNFLEQDPNFSVYTARDFETGEYAPEIKSYFKNNRNSIAIFRSSLMNMMNALFRSGLIKRNEPIDHVRAPSKVAMRLYGINKWANESGIDIVLHVHFNQYQHKNAHSQPGKYSGFSIYVPDSELPNGVASLAVAKPIFNRLRKFMPVSNLPLERGGIIKSQDLIAIGSNASRRGASLLVEYGYLYEPRIYNAYVRDDSMREMAYQTYIGLKNYFKPGTDGKFYTYSDTTLLPHLWKFPLMKGLIGNTDVISLQTALRFEGLYPPPGMSLSECPINGNFGSCVASSVKLFQERHKEETLFPYGLTAGTGYVDTFTLTALNSRYAGF